MILFHHALGRTPRPRAEALPSHDAEAAAVLLQRVPAFLDRAGASPR